MASPRLSAKAVGAIGDPETDVYVSAASAWEIATKVRLGKLQDMADRLAFYRRDLAADGFRTIVIGEDHALLAGSLPGKHGDPFDRLLAAQALVEDLVVVTRDPAIAGFGCKVLW